MARASEGNSERAVLEALLAAPPRGLTRAELHEITGLSPATLVSLLRSEKKGAGRLTSLVEQRDDVDGRIAHYQLREDSAFAIGLDLGRRHVTAGLGNASGRVLEHPHRRHLWQLTRNDVASDQDPWGAMDTAADLAYKLLTEFEELTDWRRDRFAGIGVSVTTAIDPSGMFRAMDAWEGLRVATELGERLANRGLTCPLVIEKDANLGALAYQRTVEGRALDDFLYVKWAHGISAGVVMGGRLQRGANGSAGAFGHTPIIQVLENDGPRPSALWKPDRHRCEKCGKKDCLEAMIGVERLRRVVAEHSGNRGSDQASWPSFEDIESAALRQPDGFEAQVLRAAAKRLGNALGGLVNMLNPQQIVIGGLMGRRDSDLLAGSVRHGIRDVAVGPAYRDVDLRFTDLSIIEGTLSAVVSGERLADLLALRQRRDARDRVTAAA